MNLVDLLLISKTKFHFSICERIFGGGDDDDDDDSGSSGVPRIPTSMITSSKCDTNDYSNSILFMSKRKFIRFTHRQINFLSRTYLWHSKLRRLNTVKIKSYMNSNKKNVNHISDDLLKLGPIF